MTARLGAFERRHIGTTHSDQELMLASVGFDSTDALMDAAIPDTVDHARRRGGATTSDALPGAVSETEALSQLRRLASMNRVTTPMIGLGYYGTITPAVIQRNVLENPSWYTAYTPYQPEISQGRLEALINFQTMVGDLTGLDIANASMLDESTAVVEGMLLARRASGSSSNVFLVDADALPQTKRLLARRAEAVGISLQESTFEALPEPADAPDAFGAFVQYPGASGRVWNPRAVVDAVHARGGLVVMATDLLAVTLLTPPGELGADVAVGNSQRFGVPMGFGGPHAGFMAVRKGLERQLPGRLIGVSQDADGHPAYRLSLQAREQHIRREKATSNICTAQVLLAVMASMYAVYHGPDGLRYIASSVHDAARTLESELDRRNLGIVHRDYFDTIRVTGFDARAAWSRLRGMDVTALVVDDRTLQLAVDEALVVSTMGELAVSGDGEHPLLARIADAIAGAPPSQPGPSRRVEGAPIPSELRRASEFLTHPTFHRYHSETAMMRYLKQLADLDYALDRGMIPLGSCTMKLNAATEMQAVTWPEFAGLHPFAPEEDAGGYLELIRDLEGWLAAMTGYDAVSLQPNAGSQGELAGLLAIRAYHRSRGDEQRTVVLIPSSAHGTNAASAVLAGLRVVVVACDTDGNVDLGDLRAKTAEHRTELAALMITYPSTHGVYEHDVRAMCDAVHEAGGQVYIDGANLNALVGYGRFGDFGGDVSHLNLHKTFCIPHGGGGPGVGPVAAKSHLAPFLPWRASSPHVVGGAVSETTDSGAAIAGWGASSLPQSVVSDTYGVSAAPFGSPSILPISWAYVRMMGAAGLRAATAAAVLSANYLAARLRDAYPVLYAGDHGLVAHECILDLRPLREATGITVDDVAKRLIDYGFHAPTMSFPVAGTLMVEPTESEDLAELERFVEAMVAIRAEADAVAAGEWAADDNPLVNAPHTARSLVAEWAHPYSRELAVYPVPGVIRRKYWPPVRRIDQAYGDRNLMCECPPIEAFA